MEARTSSIPETDETLSKANPLEVGLKALRASSHPQSSQFLRALESPIQIMLDLLNENQHLQKELNDSQILQECLRAEIKQLQKELQRQPSSKGVPERYLLVENQRLQQELQELKSTQEALSAHWQAENQQLRHELEELQKDRQQLEKETTAEKMPAPRMIAFTVQVQRTGETHGYEKHFMWDVAKLLNCYKISLQVEESQEGSKHPLLLFSPIGSRPGTDIDNALNGLKSTQNVLLVVFHHKPKSNTKFFADIMPELQHPALVGAVHARFSIEDGFYPCQMNRDAVEYVAAAIRTFT